MDADRLSLLVREMNSDAVGKDEFNLLLDELFALAGAPQPPPLNPPQDKRVPIYNAFPKFANHELRLTFPHTVRTYFRGSTMESKHNWDAILEALDTVFEKQDFVVSKKGDLNKRLDAVKEKSEYVIFGAFQSGKSKAMLSIGLHLAICKNTSSVIVIRNDRGDKYQLTSRMDSMLRELALLAGEHHENVYEVIDEVKGDSKKLTKKEMTNALVGERPKVYIVLRNVASLKELARRLEKSKIKRFATIIDECDALDSGKRAGVQEKLRIIKENSTIVFNVSGTVLTTLGKEKIHAKNLIYMHPPPEYRGLTHITPKSLYHPVTYCSRRISRIMKNDPNFGRYVRNLVETKKPYECYHSSDMKHALVRQYHPVISLVRATRVTEPQHELEKFVHKKYGTQITTIVYTEDSILLRGNGVGKKVIVNKVEYTSEACSHTLPHVQIGDVLAYLQNSGGVEVHPLIMIFSGAKAERGISFVASDYGEKMARRSIAWHLTEMYITYPESISQPNMLQIAGRLCGNFSDDVPLTLYSNKSDVIFQAFNAQREIVERCASTNAGAYVYENIAKEKMSRKKINADHPLLVEGTLDIQIVKGDDGGWDWKEKGLVKKIGIAMRTKAEIEADREARRLEKEERKVEKEHAKDHVLRAVQDFDDSKPELYEIKHLQNCERLTCMKKSIYEFIRDRVENGSVASKSQITSVYMNAVKGSVQSSVDARIQELIESAKSIPTFDVEGLVFFRPLNGVRDWSIRFTNG